MAENIMSKPLDGTGLSIVNSIFNDRLAKKADTTALPTKTSQLTNDSGFITGQDVPAWAKESVKPSYTATEVGAIPLALADSFAKKSDISGAYIYKGSVATFSALPSENLTSGDVYNVEDSGMNYGWTGSAWDALGQMFQLEALSEDEINTIMGVTD